MGGAAPWPGPAGAESRGDGAGHRHSPTPAPRPPARPACAPSRLAGLPSSGPRAAPPPPPSGHSLLHSSSAHSLCSAKRRLVSACGWPGTRQGGPSRSSQKSSPGAAAMLWSPRGSRRRGGGGEAGRAPAGGAEGGARRAGRGAGRAAGRGGAGGRGVPGDTSARPRPGAAGAGGGVRSDLSPSRPSALAALAAPAAPAAGCPVSRRSPGPFALALRAAAFVAHPSLRPLSPHPASPLRGPFLAPSRSFSFLVQPEAATPLATLTPILGVGCPLFRTTRSLPRAATVSSAFRLHLGAPRGSLGAPSTIPFDWKGHEWNGGLATENEPVAGLVSF